MANGQGATWSTVGVEIWRRRMSRLRQQAIEQPVVFVVGSGLSFERATNKGVADVETLVRWIRDEFHLEVPEGPPWQIYQKAIQQLDEAAGPDEVGRLIRKAALAAYRSSPATSELVRAAEGPPCDAQEEACRKLELRPGDWELPPGVIGLGSFIASLVDARRQQPMAGLGPVQIVTTNFDPLVEVALRGFGVNVTSRSIPHDARPQLEACEACVCHVHGSWWDATLHKKHALEKHRSQLETVLAAYLKHAQVPVLGYGGWQDIVSTTIADTMNLFGGKPNVIWAFFEADEKTILEKYREPLERLDSSIGASHVMLYRGVDLHVELPKLAGDVVPDLAVAPPPGPDVSAVQTNVLERLRLEIDDLLEAAPESAQPKLCKLLGTRENLPDLCAVLGELLLVLRPMSLSKERRAFERSILSVLSTLSQCVLAGGSGAERAEQGEGAPYLVESAAMAELWMAAHQDRAWRFQPCELGALGDAEVIQGADEAYDCAQYSLLEPGPDIEDWVRAFEALLWDPFRPDTRYDQAQHQAQLSGELRARTRLKEQAYALVDSTQRVPWDGIRERMPEVRFFVRAPARTTSPPLDQYELAALVQRLLSAAPDLSVTPSPVKGISR